MDKGQVCADSEINMITYILNFVNPCHFQNWILVYNMEIREHASFAYFVVQKWLQYLVYRKVHFDVFGKCV
jgi:hypothetical protein